MSDYPYTNARFIVEIEGLVLGGFSKVSGLDIQTELEPVKEGGVNYTTWQLPGQTSFTDIVLENGIADYSQLWPWYFDVINGKITRRNGTIYLVDNLGNKSIWWDFLDAFPHNWKGPTFDASQASVAVQEITLAHHGLSAPQGAR